MEQLYPDQFRIFQGSSNTPPVENNWTALQVFCLFRFLLSLTFLGFMQLNTGPSFLGHTNGALFAGSIHFYLAFSAFTLFLVIIKKPNFFIQVNVPIFIDIAIIILLMHSSGGVISGLGLLLLVMVAAQTLLTPGKLSLLIASLASLAILSETIYADFTKIFGYTAYSQAGMLGLAILISTAITNRLSIRAQKIQAILRQRGEKLANALQLNAHVVSIMQEGVIVFDKKQEIQLINTAAEELLKLNPNQSITTLNDLPMRFQHALKNTRNNPKKDEHFQIAKDSKVMRLMVKTLTDPSNNPTGTLVFLYDIVKERQQAQTLKLAALGSLAANIAHEIRNPLSSVSHAAQLLIESMKISEDDLKLAKIIKQNSDRMNIVIKNVLNLSRKDKPIPETINLNVWLNQFVKDLKIPNLKDINIALNLPDRDTLVHIDPSQLHQILINLCENGLRYSKQKNGKATLKINLSIPTTNNTLQLDIIDNGSGPEAATIKHLFEPFFTTEDTGSGLGLYIAKELSQLNNSELNYIPNVNEGGHFRLQIPEYKGAQ